MPFVKFLLRTDRSNKKGHHPIYMKVSSRGDKDRAFKSLGFWIPKSSWDSKKELVKSRGGSNDSSYIINEVILSLRKKAENIFREEQAKKIIRKSSGNVYKKETAEGLKNLILGNLSKNKTLHKSFTEYCISYYKKIKEEDRYNTFKSFRAVTNKLTRYINSEFYTGNDLTFGDINIAFIKTFREWLLQEEGNSVNTANKNITELGTIYSVAIKEEYIPIVENPFHHVSFKSEETKKIPLYAEEFKAIKFLNLNDPELEQYQDYLLFQTYTGGMRVSDLCTITGYNIKNNKRLLTYTAKKNKRAIKVRLVDPAVNILSKYKIEGGKFIFPLISGGLDDYKTDSVLVKEINRVTNNLNDRYKIIAKKAGLKKNVTTHITRHTFAWMAICSGWSKEEIQRALGHKNISTTEQYLSHFSNLDIDEKMDKLFETDMKKVG